MTKLSPAISSFGRAARTKLANPSATGEPGDQFHATSPLGAIQPEAWLPEYTTELLNVLGWLVEFEPAQAVLLEKICADPTLSAADLRAAGCRAAAPGSPRIAVTPDEPDLFAQL